ncbi:MAG: cytochrome c biogenesis protein CcsA [Planctomycetes bacterium]|nr:cytochrome c biogenesis protein CcsA [Planctomycetota bacterium]
MNAKRISPVLPAVLFAAFCALPCAQAEVMEPESHGPSVQDEEAAAQGHVHDHGDGHDHDHGDGLPPAVLTGDLDFSFAEGLVVQDGGRLKPLHTYANELAAELTGRGFMGGAPSYQTAGGQKLGPVDLLFSIWFATRDWDEESVILVSYRPLVEKLGLSPEKKRFSLNELWNRGPGAEELRRILTEAQGKSAKQEDLTTMEREARIVWQRINLISGIRHGEVPVVPHPADDNGVWVSMNTFRLIVTNPERALESAAQNYFEGDFQEAGVMVEAYLRSLAKAGSKVDAAISGFQKLIGSYRSRDAAAFTAAGREFREAVALLSAVGYPDPAAVSREIHYNQLRPFAWAWGFYLLALLSGLLAFRAKATWPFAPAWAFFLAGLALHVYAFVLRCWIAGRPPVTNMYESVIWVGFGIVFFGLVFELRHRPRYYLLCGAAGGFLCLVLMDLLPVFSGKPTVSGFDPSIGPLVPVLRDNFWLTVHVLSITLSYSAFALAWLLAHATMYKHLARPGETTEHHQMHQYLYRVIQIGVLLLATGTILGGVWAYYSWGRFWGWDPKETWAFIALLCYLVVLHGRFTGYWGNFGLSVGALVCFQAVVMAWYGVNFVLGKGLHSYGFGEGAANNYIAVILGLDLLFTGAAVYRHLSYKRTKAAGAEKTEHRLTPTDPVDEARAALADTQQ